LQARKYPLKNYEGEKLALMKQDILEIAILEVTPASRIQQSLLDSITET
jgi:hypothetical protein